MKNVTYHKFGQIAAYIFVATCVLLSSACDAQSLLALSKRNHTLAIVDPVSLKVVARIPVGEDPHEVVASTDGKTAYVSIYGGGSLHELNVIDLVAQTPLVNVDTRPLWGPHGLVFADGKAWFTAEGSKSVGSYDPATGKVDWSIGTGQDRTHMIFVSDSGKRIYTTNVLSGTVSILIDTLIAQGPPPPMKNSGQLAPPGNMPPPPGPGREQHDNWEQTVIPVSRGSEGLDVSPDGRELWTASAEDGNIFIVNLNAKKLDTKIDANISGANRVKFTTDGKLVFITSLRTGDLVIYDVESRKEIKKINLGHGAAGILMEPNGHRAFIGCSADNYVAVIDIKTLEVTGHIDVGGEPDGLAWAVKP